MVRDVAYFLIFRYVKNVIVVDEMVYSTMRSLRVARWYKILLTLFKLQCSHLTSVILNPKYVNKVRKLTN